VERIGERAHDLAEGIARGAGAEQVRADARDFLSARERGWTTGTRIEQQTAALSDAAEIVNRSFPRLDPRGGSSTPSRDRPRSARETLRETARALGEGEG
jgi:hypothetical protein